MRGGCLKDERPSETTEGVFGGLGGILELGGS